MSTTFKDSGERAEFATGAVRDKSEGKGRFDLLPADAVRQLARVMETGCQKYGDRDWERGIPLRKYLDSALRHLHCLMAGMEDEPHLPMALWNIACLIQTEIWIRRGQLPGCLREGWPFQVRLLETGDVQAFAEDTPSDPPASSWWSANCTQCGTCRDVPLHLPLTACAGCGCLIGRPAEYDGADAVAAKEDSRDH